MMSLRKYWTSMTLKCLTVHNSDHYFKYTWTDHKNKEYIALNLKCGKIQ